MTSEPHAILELDDAPFPPAAFGPPREVVSASGPGEVLPALARIEAAARAGRWAVGWLAAEAGPALDPALGAAPPAGPLLWFGLHDAPLGPPPGGSDDAALEGLAPELDEAAHAVLVCRIREAIARGDVYQVNLTFRLRGRLRGTPLALYRRLRRAQGGGQTAYVRAGGRAVVSASPELFLTRAGGLVASRPMKGTARRGRYEVEDEARRAGLLGSPKERAENVMIADLVRNDLGRVAVPGTVAVEALCAAERWPTVWQLTSTVSARLREGASLAELLAATFPPGSVTGAPKSTATRLIAALEPSPRGAYCGAIGAVAPGGDLAFNVAIRTAEVDLTTGEAAWGVGGGITWDSEARREWDEALAKAAILEARPDAPALLETMRLEAGRVALLDRHLARLASSARWLGRAVDLGALRARVEAERGDGRLRLLVDDSGRARLERSPLPGPPAAPVELALAEERVDSRDPTLFHKTSRREPYERRRASRPGAFDVVLVNERGEVTETTIGSLVVFLDGARVTPPLAAGLLPGVQRGRLLDASEVRERPLTLAELRRADRLWLVNAVRGEVEARLVR